jgi:toxin YoeB
MIVFDEDAWTDHEYWVQQDRRRVARIKALIRDIARGAGEHAPNSGFGKPEALKHGLHGCWSRRINDEHCIVYKVVCD